MRDATEQGGYWPPTPEWSLVIVTAILAWFTFRLWRATGKLVTEAQETAKRQLRAYVTFKGTHFNTGRSGNQTTFIANGLITNYGQTPAYDITATGGLAIGPAELGTDAEIMTLPEPTQVGGILGPKADTSLYQPALSVTPAEVAEVRAGTAKKLYYLGVLTYRDSFGDRWRLRYRFFVHFDASGVTAFLATADHNDEQRIGREEPAPPVQRPTPN